MGRDAVAAVDHARPKIGGDSFRATLLVGISTTLSYERRKAAGCFNAALCRRVLSS